MHVDTPDTSMGNHRQNRPETPTSNNLQAPLLHVLGELSSYRPRVFFPSTLRKGTHDPLRDDVLRAAGYDPGGSSRLLVAGTLAEDVLEEPPLELHGTRPAMMYRRIYLGAQQRSSTYTKKRKILPLFVMSDDGWGLTEAGVAAATKIRPAFARYHNVEVEVGGKTHTVRRMVRNVTQVWLDGQLSAGLYEIVLRHLLHEPRLSKERTSGEITDHFHQFLSDVIRRDSFHRWLARGDAPTVRQMCLWATRKGISAMRKYAKDALHRHTRGALTARERAEGRCCRDAMIASRFQVVIEGGEEGRPETGERVIVDPSDVERREHDLASAQGIDRVREAVRLHKPGAPDRYERVFGLMLQGTPVAEIGRLEGVSRNRAASLMADTRAAIRAAVQSSLDARALLQYVEAEGFPSRDDMVEAIVNPKDPEEEHSLVIQVDGKGPVEKLARKRVGWLLDEMLSRGRLRQHFNHRKADPDTGRKRWVECDAADDGACEFFSLTGKGEAFLTEWSLQPELAGDFGHRVSL